MCVSRCSNGLSRAKLQSSAFLKTHTEQVVTFGLRGPTSVSGMQKPSFYCLKYKAGIDKVFLKTKQLYTEQVSIRVQKPCKYWNCQKKLFTNPSGWSLLSRSIFPSGVCITLKMLLSLSTVCKPHPETLQTGPLLVSALCVSWCAAADNAMLVMEQCVPESLSQLKRWLRGLAL